MRSSRLGLVEQSDVAIAAILGPTASGKTGLAVALRREGIPVEAVNCDALQVFDSLDAATAKPTRAQMEALPHHIIGVIPVGEQVDAARWAQLADQAISSIAQRRGWPLVVGGTGLYFRTLIRGLAPIPAVPPAVRQQLAERWRLEGADALHAELSRVDPAYASATPAANRQRVLRALEVHAATGTAFSAFHRAAAQRPARYRCVTIVLDPPREALTQRIDERARAMVPALLRECRQLLEDGVHTGLHSTQALGYREALSMLQTDTVDERALAEHLCRAHRKYAKRQRTWFRKIAADCVIESPLPADRAVVVEVADLLRRHFEA